MHEDIDCQLILLGGSDRDFSNVIFFEILPVRNKYWFCLYELHIKLKLHLLNSHTHKHIHVHVYIPTQQLQRYVSGLQLLPMHKKKAQKDVGVWNFGYGESNPELPRERRQC